MMKYAMFTLTVLLLIAGCAERITTSDSSLQVPIELPTIPIKTEPVAAPVTESAEEPYKPTINPLDFSNEVTNRYLPLVPGQKAVFLADTEDGRERIEVYVTDKNRLVMGVKTVVVWDRVWLNDELIEDTMDWYAQDAKGNVWYFGEETSELIDGKIINHDGSWEAGIDGAQPGIAMKANPLVGDKYRQEYYAGIAEDMGEVLAIGQKVTVPYGLLGDCIQTRDWTPLEPDAQEHKYYCPGIGTVLEITLDGGEKVELISIEKDAQASPSVLADASQEMTSNPPQALTTKITEAQAEELALREVPGRVTDIAIERKLGRIAFVVEVDADDGPETDVFIDAETGEVLAVE